MAFHGRERELAQLQGELNKSGASLVIVSGRRRIGKSALLREVAKDRAHVYFQATIGPSVVNLQALKHEISRSLGGSPVLDGIANWEGLLHFLAEEAERLPALTVILDEFPYLLEDDKSLPSVLQRFWDSGAADAGSLKLILCGSAISQMRALLNESNPLYGRSTKKLALTQLPLRDITGFFPAYDAEDIIRTYAIFGGVPHYLSLCDPSASFRENVVSLLMEETGPLLEEPEFLLKTEFDKPRMYSGILSAMAAGRSSLGDIAGRLNVASTDLPVYIERLRMVDLVKVERSLHADDRSKNRRYRLNDRLLTFWYEFVEPNRSAIANGFGELIFDVALERDFPAFMGPAFEEMCRQYAARHLGELAGSPAVEIGSLWGFKDFDIDVAGKLLNGSFFFGEAKWRSDRFDMGMVKKLQQNANLVRYAPDEAKKLFLLFSRSGFKADVVALAEADASIKLITPQMLLEPSGPRLDVGDEATQGHAPDR